MGTINQATVLGFLGDDAEVKKTAKGHAVANFRMATNEVWKNEKGEQMRRTEWHRIVLWGSLAQKLGPFLKKGRHVCVIGRLQTRQWENGEGKSYMTTEIIGNDVRLIDSYKSEGKKGEPRKKGQFKETGNKAV